MRIPDPAGICFGTTRKFILVIVIVIVIVIDKNRYASLCFENMVIGVRNREKAFGGAESFEGLRFRRLELRTRNSTLLLHAAFRVFGGIAPSGDAFTPRKHENRRKLKRPVSQNFWWYGIIKPKAFSTHTRAPARETLQIAVIGPPKDRGASLCAKSFSASCLADRLKL